MKNRKQKTSDRLIWSSTLQALVCAPPPTSLNAIWHLAILIVLLLLLFSLFCVFNCQSSDICCWGFWRCNLQYLSAKWPTHSHALGTGINHLADDPNPNIIEMLLLWLLLFILDRPIDGLQSANLFAFLLSALLYILTTFLKNLQFKKMFARFYYRFLHLRLPTVNFALHSFLFDAIYGSDHTLFRSSSLVIISFCLPILVQLSVSVCRLQLIACRVVLHQGQAIVLLPQPKQCSRTVHKASWHYRRFFYLWPDIHTQWPVCSSSTSVRFGSIQFSLPIWSIQSVNFPRCVLLCSSLEFIDNKYTHQKR